MWCNGLLSANISRFRGIVFALLNPPPQPSPNSEETQRAFGAPLPLFPLRDRRSSPCSSPGRSSCQWRCSALCCCRWCDSAGVAAALWVYGGVCGGCSTRTPDLASTHEKAAHPGNKSCISSHCPRRSAMVDRMDANILRLTLMHRESDVTPIYLCAQTPTFSPHLMGCLNEVIRRDVLVTAERKLAGQDVCLPDLSERETVHHRRCRCRCIEPSGAQPPGEAPALALRTGRHDRTGPGALKGHRSATLGRWR